MKNEFPNGVWPVMLTPYTEDNKIDYPALEKLTEWYFENDCDGLFAVCQSSEMFQLTLEERCKIAAAVKKYANGKPVIASGHISDSMEDQEEELKRMADTGIDALILISNRPAAQQESDQVMIERLQTLMEQLPKDIKWHMIGHLQRNKVKYIVDKVALIHSVDSVRLAEEIHKEAMKIGRRVPVLIEVNVAGEETKFGVAPEEVEELIRKIAPFEGIEVQGLMTIAPFVTNPEENRQYFNRLKQLSVDISHKNIDNINMNVLSMGMTGDYEVAIEEGASFVRVGTGIFRERNYTI